MKIKKLLKYLPMTVIAAGLAVATSPPPLSLLNNSDHLKNQIFNVDQAVDETEYTDQLEYIRNDVAKQDGVTDSVKSIKLSDDGSFLYESSAALVTKTDGSTLIYMWGRNNSGQLGNGTEINATTPTLVDATPFGSRKITQIAFGGYHSAALLADGSLYMWGSNYYGQLGNGTTDDASTPTLVDSTPFGTNKITQIELGYDCSAAILEDGSLYMWGNNNLGQLGNGLITNTSTPTPVDSTPFGSRKITQVAIGTSHSAAHLDDGSLYMWGSNEYGQLGNGTKVNTSTPILVTTTKFTSPIDQIKLSLADSAALLEDGSLYMWGLNQRGQLGNGGTTDATTPALVTDLSGKKITQIALGERHSAALLDDGSLYTWGSNYYGQLFNSVNTFSTTANPTPTLVTTIKSTSPVAQIALGMDHSAALLEDGSLYMCGFNTSGQFGNGTTTQINSKPIWIRQFGKDSHITANSAITAKEAYDQFWVGNRFWLDGFKKSFNLINIYDPLITGQEITMTTAPTYDNSARTVTMNVKIKYYYDENGLLVADTAANTMTIGGFKEAIKTNIAVKTNLLNSVVVDKWLDYVTVDGKINRAKLQEFLTLTDVPNEAIFTITENGADNKTGILTFKISTNKVINGSGVTIDTPADFDPFPITLNLTPRITKMTAITTGYPSSLTAATLKAILFDNTGLVKDVNELQKYMTIIAPVDNAKYYLVENSWVPHTGDGTVKFDIYVDKYYDDNADEQTGSASLAASKVSFNLKLQPEASTIAVKATMPDPDVRIDKFETYVKSAGTKVEGSKLGEFFDLTNIPSDATFTINNVKPDEYDADFTRNHLTFDLTINKFNQGSPATPQTYAHNYELTLGTQHQPTAITAKTTHDKTIRVDKVANELNTLKDEALLTYLSNFLDFTSIPDGETISVKNVVPNDSTGKLSFEVVPSKIYNSTSDLAPPTTGQFLFDLQFDIKHAPTDITINSSYPKVRIDEFANKISNLEGQALYNYLAAGYITATSVDQTKLTARIISQDNQSGKIQISLTIPSYYNADSDLVREPKSYTFDYELNPKYQQTVIKALDDSAYPKDITPAQFKQQIIDGGATINGSNYTLTPTNITFLKRFLSFESTPASTVYTLTWNAGQTNDVTGALSFNLSLSQYYSAAGDLVTSALPVNNLTLNLLGTDVPPVYPETIITTKANAPLISSSQSFLDTVYPNSIVSSDKLSIYLDGLQTIPTSGNITSIASKTTTDSTASFMLEVSAHYNASGTLQGSKSFEFSLKLTPKYTQTKISVLPVGTYPSDLTPTQFKEQLVADGASVNGNIYDLNNTNITFLSKFLDLTTVPPSTTYSLTLNNEQTSDTTGQLGFNLVINQYYNADGDLVTNVSQPFNDLVLQLTNVDAPPIKSATNLKTKVGSQMVASKDTFMQMIHDSEGNLIYVKLSEFIDGLASIPTNAIVTVTHLSTNQGTAIFEIKLSGYYDGTSADMINEEKAYNFEVNVQYTAPANDQFQWWWIVIGVGAAAFIGVVIWLTIKRRKEAAAKAAEGEPKPEEPKDGEPKTEDGEPKPEENKTSESENKPEAAKSEEEVQSEATENKLKNKLNAKLDVGKLKAKSKIDQATKWVKTSKDNITSKLKTPDIED